MSKTRRKKRPPKRVLALPDLEQSKAAVLNSLTSKSGQRTYDRAITDFVEYRSEPRLSFNRTVVLRYRIFLEQKRYAPTTINLRLAAVRRVAFEAADSGLQSGIGRWHPTGQGCSADRCPAGKLADSRARKAAFGRDRPAVLAWQEELRNAGDVDWMRASDAANCSPYCRFHSRARATLGHC
jgi:hypothetical protein